MENAIIFKVMAIIIFLKTTFVFEKLQILTNIQGNLQTYIVGS